MKHFLVIDTETTGIPNDTAYRFPPTYLEEWCIRAIQVAWQVYDERGKLLEEYCNLIKPVGFEVPNQDFWIKHNLTQERCLKEGVDLLQATKAFIDVVSRYDNIAWVGHNAAFDKAIWGSELVRAGAIEKGLDPMKLSIAERASYMLKTGKKLDAYCTLRGTMNWIKLPSKNGGFEYKFPRLEETYSWCFPGEVPIQAHDALGDVKATARIFFECLKKGYMELKQPAPSL